VNSRMCRPPDGAIQMQPGDCTKDLGRFREPHEGRRQPAGRRARRLGLLFSVAYNDGRAERVIVEATELPSTCDGIFWRGCPTLWNLPGVRIRP